MSKQTHLAAAREPGSLSLSMTREEADALLQLVDIALKAAGLPVAQAATHLASRIIAARDMSASTSSDPQN